MDCGGRVAVIHHDQFNVSTIDLGRFTEFGYLSVKLRSPTAPSQIKCSVSNAFCDKLLLSVEVDCYDFNSPGDDGELVSDRPQQKTTIVEQ